MTNDSRLMAVLADVLDSYPRHAPDHLLSDVVAGVESERQIRRWPDSPRFMGHNRNSTRRAPVGLLAAAACVTAIVLVMGQLSSGFAPRPGGVGASAVPSRSGSSGSTLPQRPSVDYGIFEPLVGRIVYSRTGSSLWALDPRAPADPPTKVELTVDAGMPLGWSGDGTRLLIMRFSGSEQHLFVLNADGSEAQVSETTVIRGAAISPDGSRVVYAGSSLTPEGDCCESWALYAVDATGGPAQVLARSRTGILDDLAFSPDGTRIAYADGGGDNNHHIWVMNADGSDAHEIASEDCACHVYGLAWSPAGDRIALGLEGKIYTFATDGSAFAQVTTQGDQPYWSPDGSRIAYTVSCDADPVGCGLAIADADGSNVVTFDSSAGSSGPWHPGKLVNDASE